MDAQATAQETTQGTETVQLTINDPSLYEKFLPVELTTDELVKLSENVNTPRNFYDLLHSQEVSSGLHRVLMEMGPTISLVGADMTDPEVIETYFKNALRKILTLKSSAGKRVQVMVKASCHDLAPGISFYPKWIPRNRNQFSTPVDSDGSAVDEVVEVVNTTDAITPKKIHSKKKSTAINTTDKK